MCTCVCWVYCRTCNTLSWAIIQQKGDFERANAEYSSQQACIEFEKFGLDKASATSLAEKVRSIKALSEKDLGIEAVTLGDEDEPGSNILPSKSLRLLDSETASLARTACRDDKTADPLPHVTRPLHCVGAVLW